MKPTSPSEQRALWQPSGKPPWQLKAGCPSALAQKLYRAFARQGVVPSGRHLAKASGVTVRRQDVEVKDIFSEAKFRVKGNRCIVSVVGLHEDDVDAALGR